MRKDPLVNNEIYHVFNRSIAGYVIFSNPEDYSRMIELISYYRFIDLPYNYSKMLTLSPSNQKQIFNNLIEENNKLIEIIAYVIMPTHFHLILKQLVDNGVSTYLSKICDGYTKYFNIKHGRKGPLWEGHFENVLVLTDEQLVHLTRYIHLNPVTAGLIKNPQDWHYSSFKEYLNETTTKLCTLDNLIDIEPQKYKKFVLDQVNYQKKIALIKGLLIDNYSG